MKCVTVKEPGSHEQLQITEAKMPMIETGELLIKVHNAAVNRTDIIAREGRVNHLESPILGVEVSGEVIATAGACDFSIGDRVMGLVNGGAYAEYAKMPVDRAMRIPEAMSYAEAAAIPEVFLTAYQTLYWLGKLEENETVLIHAGASGVGTAAIQLAKQISNAKVIVTAGSQRKLDFCKKLGADVVINYKEQAFDEAVLKATGGEGVDLILDFIGASYWTKNLASIKKEGRWVLIGVLGGSVLESVDLLPIMSKCIQLTGTLLTPRSDAYKAKLAHEFSERVMPYFESQQIKPIIDTQFSLLDIAKAHLYMEQNQNIGKIIIDVIE